MSIEVNSPETVASRHFVLPVDVPNPVHDGRCRHGLRGVKTFKAGTTVYAVDYDQSVVVQGKRIVRSFTEYRVGRVVREVAPESLAALLAPHDTREARPASTLEEVSTEEGVSVNCICEYAVRRLLADGTITIADVQRFYRES